MNLVRRAALTALAAILLASGVMAPSTIAHPRAGAVGDPDLTQPIGTQWLTNGGNLTNQRYSTLDQITTSNAANLNAAWMVHLGSGTAAKYSQEATPLVQDGVMYVPTGNDDIFALNAATGARIWSYHSHINQKITTVCCGWDDRGVALGHGLVFSAQLDGSVVAISQATGERIWQHKVVKWEDGYGLTAAPLYFDGLVYIGTVGGEFGTRGIMLALDAATGNEVWRFYTIPGPHDFGGNSWPANSDAYIHGGAPIWNTPTLDPELGLLYFSTGNAGPDLDGSVRPGNNLFASCILALNARTGKLAWYFQEVHHDIWDFDAPSPTLLFNTTINGRLRLGIGQVGKTGWAYLLDRTNGKPLVGINEKPVPQYGPQHTAATQPYPVGDAVVPQCAEKVAGFPRSACIFDPVTEKDTVFAPLFEGGVVQSPMSFSPQTGYLYIGANIWPFDAARKTSPYKKGQFYAGIGPLNTLLGAHRSGTLTAIDSRTNKIAWQLKTAYPLGEGSGTLATAGGLLFSGQPDGLLKAYNAGSGKQLWQWQTGYGADAPAISYEVNGTQYVAIAAGGNSLIQSKIGDAVWAFSLKGPASGVALAPAAAPAAPFTVVKITGMPIKINKLFMVDFAFAANPAFAFGATIITVPVGSTVTWTNVGTQPHTATSASGGWDTGLVQPGGKASVVMKKVGTFTYTCLPHPWMLGEVIVTR